MVACLHFKTNKGVMIIKIMDKDKVFMERLILWQVC